MTLPEKQPVSVGVIVSVAVPPCVIDNVVADGEIVKAEAGTATVIAMFLNTVRLPEVPVIVIVVVPAAIEQPEVNVSTLVLVVGSVPKLAVIPLGKPDTASVTAPVKPPMSVTVIVSVAVAPGVTVIAEDDGVSVKPGPVFTVSEIVVDAVNVPEVPVIVTTEVPIVAVLLAANVTTLLPVAGFVPNVAVTPLGRPEAASVTAPVKPPTSVTLMVSVALDPSPTDAVVVDGARVKLCGAVTVSAIVVDAISEPDVPVIVTVDVPAVAELLAANVTTLEPVAGFVPNVAVTPLGKPGAARVTAPVKLPVSDTLIVSVALAPWATETELAEDESVKLPPPLPPLQVTPFKVKDAGTAFVVLFHDPLKPTLVRLPPAGILPS